MIYIRNAKGLPLLGFTPEYIGSFLNHQYICVFTISLSLLVYGLYKSIRYNEIAFGIENAISVSAIFAEDYASRSISVSSKGADVPTRKDKFEEAINEGIDREAVRLDGVDYLPITQETIDKVKGIYEEAGVFTEEYLFLCDLVYEESLPLFSGDKNVDDVVAIISGRYNLYIDEMK